MTREAAPEIDHLARLIGKLRYWQSVDEDKGPAPGRTADQVTIGWALDELRELYPDAYVEALEVAARRDRWRRERAARAPHAG